MAVFGDREEESIYWEAQEGGLCRKHAANMLVGKRAYRDESAFRKLAREKFLTWYAGDLSAVKEEDVISHDYVCSDGHCLASFAVERAAPNLTLIDSAFVHDDSALARAEWEELVMAFGQGGLQGSDSHVWALRRVAAPAPRLSRGRASGGGGGDGGDGGGADLGAEYELTDDCIRLDSAASRACVKKRQKWGVPKGAVSYVAFDASLPQMLRFIAGRTAARLEDLGVTGETPTLWATTSFDDWHLCSPASARARVLARLGNAGGAIARLLHVAGRARIPESARIAALFRDNYGGMCSDPDVFVDILKQVHSFAKSFI